MFNLQTAWGYTVGNLPISGRITCQSVSTHSAYATYTSASVRGKLGVFRKVTDRFPNYFTQAKSSFFYLIDQLTIHISTDPITTTKKKGFLK